MFQHNASETVEIWHILVLAAEQKAEYAHSESEASQGVAELKELEEASSENNGEDSEKNQETEQDDIGSETSLRTFSYDQLKARSENPVTGIDFKRREVGAVDLMINVIISFHLWFKLVFTIDHHLVLQAYLSDEEFQSIFGKTKEAFYKLPKWKQDMQKKKFDLF